MISWVAMDRIVERKRATDATYRKQAAEKVLRSDAKRLTDGELLAKLRSFGIELDRPFAGAALRAGAVGRRDRPPLLDQRTFHGRQASRWKATGSGFACRRLWQRWFPDQPSFELLDDKMQAGYDLRESGAVAACRIWLEAWSDVLRILDKAGMQSIQEFDERFGGSNRCSTGFRIWKTSCGMRGWRIGSFSPPGSRCAKKGCGAFRTEDDLMTENRRRALAESYYELGETDKAEALYRGWLHLDPRWGWGWIGWSDCYRIHAHGAARLEPLRTDPAGRACHRRKSGIAADIARPARRCVRRAGTQRRGDRTP